MLTENIFHVYSYIVLSFVYIYYKLSAYWVILHAFLSSVDFFSFFKINFFKKFFQEYRRSVKQFGSC